MPNFPAPDVVSCGRLGLPVVGRCTNCGRQAPGIPVPNMGHLCENECPRCGIKPFYLGHIAPYTGDVSLMSVPDAIAYLNTLDDPNEVETTFRLEIMGHPPRGRREYLEAAHAHYWTLAWLADPLERGKVLTLDECIDEWTRELEIPKVRRIYQGLILAGREKSPFPQAWG